ncbi:ImmA/IrrE family metallo-endopeptidase [Pedobacter sp. AW31-3R]|uniref:ImmA/IrrE family metallo-endopeptidase n=1 Tax=Pedobacter sp. AW31-3R TaxID=3445781 RepID=UPI003F9FB663
MGLTVSPQARMARRILKKHNLVVPFDLNKLVNQYAKVYYKSIPIQGVDGVCINLKKPGKIPTVIVNDDAVQVRQRFTLAHELGHIIIPWHLGTIIDEIDINEKTSIRDKQYWILESEANRFASELLMPIDFILEQFNVNPDPEFLIDQIKRKCGVSEIAAKIRLNSAITEITEILMPEENIKNLFAKSGNVVEIQSSLMANSPFNSLHIARHMCKYIPGKIAFCVEESNVVKGSGGTDSTQGYYQSENSDFQPTPFPHFQSYHIHNNLGVITHWWSLDVKFAITEDTRDWRELLDKIASDLNPKDEVDKFKRVINGKLSGLNSQRKEKSRYIEFDQFLDEALHRFNNKEYAKIAAHPDFLAFVRKRCESLFA